MVEGVAGVVVGQGMVGGVAGAVAGQGYEQEVL